MKKIYLPVLAIAFALGACTDVDKNCNTGGEDYEVRRVGMTMAESTGNVQSVATRAVAGFVVNTDNDPTYNIADKQDWTLDLTIYKSGSPYAEGHGLFTWDGSYWTSPTTIYMPHYLMQSVVATLYPASWTIGSSDIEIDQSDPDVFLEQDILVQNGVPTYDTLPAHYLKVQMRHAHSMIDLVLAEVNPDDITEVTVEAAGQTYIPFKTDVTTREEYLVILPLNISNPVIRVATKAGAKYSKELAITTTQINTCYYVRLVGLELELEALNVTNWTYGEAVAGDYSSVTSYPTFRGPAGEDITLYFDNGLQQVITFNQRGESTVKPNGRTIVRISDGTLSYTFSPPLSIRGMVIDLNEYIDMMS